MTKLTKDQAYAILSTELATAIKLDEGKDSGVRVFRTVPANWHPDVLAWVLQRFSRIAGEKLNHVTVAGGAKAKAFADVMADVNAGLVPSVLIGASRPGKVDDVESIIAEMWIEQAEAKLRPAMEAAKVGSGKRGIVKADFPAYAATQDALRSFVRAVGDGWVWDEMAIAGDGRIEAKYREAAEAELARRESEAKELAELAKSADVEAIIADLF